MPPIVFEISFPNAPEVIFMIASLGLFMLVRWGLKLTPFIG